MTDAGCIPFPSRWGEFQGFLPRLGFHYGQGTGAGRCGAAWPEARRQKGRWQACLHEARPDCLRRQGRWQPGQEQQLRSFKKPDAASQRPAG